MSSTPHAEQALPASPETGSRETSVLRRAFVPEIQAIRAIAVLAVVIYHLDPSWLPGGFTGVDAFFVVSGFLITGHLLTELRTYGRIRLARFWAGRFRRLWPAQSVVILATAAASAFLLPRSGALDSVKAALASTFYAQNWFLAAQSTDYLNNDAVASPFQHFWSLAIEEQFYLVWPLGLLAAGVLTHLVRQRVLRRTGPSRFPLAGALGVVVVITVASLILCLRLAATGGPEAYFSTFVRAWQLGAGGLLAFIPTSWRLPRRASVPLVWAGLALLGFGFVLISAQMRYPGILALVPVLGAAAIILASTRGDLSGHFPALRSRLALMIGDRSYAIYLVHWPIIVLLTAASPWAWFVQVPIALTATLVFSFALFRWVEQPARTNPRLSSHKTMFGWTALSMACVAGILLALAVAVSARPQPPTSSPFPIGNGSPHGAPALSADQKTFLAGTHEIFPDPEIAAKSDWPLVDEPHCQTESLDHTPVTCTFGTVDAHTTIALVGDSHATQWLPALQEVGANHDWRIVTYLHSSCAFSAAPRAYSPAQEEACARGNQARFEQIQNDDEIDVVLTSALAGGGFSGEGDDQETGTRGYVQFWTELEAADKDVVVLRDNPQNLGETQLTECVRKNMRHPETCALRASESLPTDRQLNAIQEVPEADLIDLTGNFCHEQTCPVVIGNVLVYRDNNHLSATFARSLGGALDEQLTGLCPRVSSLCPA